jgi:hypothetical protein
MERPEGAKTAFYRLEARAGLFHGLEFEGVAIGTQGIHECCLREAIGDPGHVI